MRHSQPTNPLKQSDEVARSTLAKVTRRLLPFLFVLGFSPAVYGLGAGMFFLGLSQARCSASMGG